MRIPGDPFHAANLQKYFKYMRVKCVTSVRIQSFSGPCFLAFGLKTEIYIVNLRIQPECDKIHTGKTPSMATFYTVFIISFKHIQYHIQPIFLHLTLIKHLFAAFLFSRDQNYVQNDLYCKISLIMMI